MARAGEPCREGSGSASAARAHRALPVRGLDLTEFRRRIDSHSKHGETGVWGFRGNAGVMFFTMLWKGAPEELAPLLRAAVSVPANDSEARAAIDRLRELARATKARTGNRNLHEAFAPFFLSFFWEAQDRDNWPMYHPASREGLERFGLLTIPSDTSDAYIAFRAAMRVSQYPPGIGPHRMTARRATWRRRHRR